MPAVSLLSIAPVKGLALVHPEDVVLHDYGVAENRRFYVVDATGRRFGADRDGRLLRIVPDYDASSNRLALRFPDGTVVDGEVAAGEPIATDFYGRDVPGRVVEGPWAAALSAYAGRPLRLVRAEHPGAGVDRSRGAVSLLSEASLERLGEVVGDAVDGRRFRMLVSVAGCRPHEEDEWIGRDVRVGDARIRLIGIVARCVITTTSPETGKRDLDTLRAIRSYRGQDEDGGIDFGVFGEVSVPGRVRVGDPVEPL